MSKITWYVYGLLPGCRLVLCRNTKTVQLWIKYVEMLKGCAEKWCVCEFCIVTFILINTCGKFSTFIFAGWLFVARGSLE
jgi:hypothetical protein